MVKNPSPAARLLCTSLTYLAVLSLGVFPFGFARVTIGPVSVPWAALFFVLLGVCLFLSLILRWIPFPRPPQPCVERRLDQLSKIPHPPGKNGPAREDASDPFAVDKGQLRSEREGVKPVRVRAIAIRLDYGDWAFLELGR